MTGQDERPKPPHVWLCCQEHPVAVVFRMWMEHEHAYGIAIACTEHEMAWGIAITRMRMELEDGGE